MARKTILQLMAQKATIDAKNSIVKYLRNQLERLLSQNAAYLLIDDLLYQIEAHLDIKN